MKKIRIAINGFGRIGRLFFRQAMEDGKIDIVGVNDLAELDNLAYLLKYDSVYGRYGQDVSVKGGKLMVGKKAINFTQEPDPAQLPWKKLRVDVVIESTGVFTEKEKAAGHLDAGAKHVVITTSAKGDDLVPTPLPGTSEAEFKKLKENITSDASCTTNAIVPVLAVLRSKPGIKAAVLNTVHGYTSTQALVDGPHKKDFRRGRAAAQNIVLTTTNAAKAATTVLPEFKGKFDGLSLRVPVLAGSIADITFVAKKKTTIAEVNAQFKKAAKNPVWKGMLKVTEEPLVSSDILGDPHLAVIDLNSTMVVDGNLVKVMAWYDNEYGYGFSLLEHVKRVGHLFSK